MTTLVQSNDKLVVVDGKLLTCCGWIVSKSGFLGPANPFQQLGDWHVRINFEDSANCGGANSNVQTLTARRYVTLAAPRTLTAQLTGRIEQENGGYDAITVWAGGQIVVQDISEQNFGGCNMQDRSRSGQVTLGAGCHLIRIHTSTVDELFHAGAFWEVQFTWS